MQSFRVIVGTHYEFLTTSITILLMSIFLMGCQPDINDLIETDNAAALEAALKKNPELLETRDNEGLPLLHKAIVMGRVAVTEVLLNQGADPNLRADFLNETPLMMAVRENHIEIVKILLEHGADPNLTNSDGVSSLHLAAYDGTENLVTLLLESGAKPGIRDKDGKTPLDWAQTEERQTPFGKVEARSNIEAASAIQRYLERKDQ